MTIYSLSQIESLTGINAHSLRIWERRYSFLKPMRTDSNIRYYNDSHLKKLLNISILTSNGIRLSKIDKMTNEEIIKKVSDILIEDQGKNEDLINALIFAMLEFNEYSFEKIFQRQVISNGFLDTMIDLIYPFLQRIGNLWITDKAMPAQEHFITNLIRQKLIYSIETLAEPSERSPRIILFLTEEEYHELGLLLAYYIAKSLNWKVYYLGQNVPTKDIIALQKRLDSKLMLTMFTAPSHKSINDRLKPILSESDSNILVSGHHSLFESAELSDGIVYLNNPKALIDCLNQE